MATVTVTKKSSETKVKDLDKAMKSATSTRDLDEMLNNIQKVDYTCFFTKCKNKTKDFAIDCKYCSGRFCTTHGLPEIHGCGEAVRTDERRKFLHPNNNLDAETHGRAQTKLTMKLKQMQLERKAKQGGRGKKK